MLVLFVPPTMMILCLVFMKDVSHPLFRGCLVGVHSLCSSFFSSCWPDHEDVVLRRCVCVCFFETIEHSQLCGFSWGRSLFEVPIVAALYYRWGSCPHSSCGPVGPCTSRLYFSLCRRSSRYLLISCGTAAIAVQFCYYSEAWVCPQQRACKCQCHRPLGGCLLPWNCDNCDKQHVVLVSINSWWFFVSSDFFFLCAPKSRTRHTHFVFSIVAADPCDVGWSYRGACYLRVWK